MDNKVTIKAVKGRECRDCVFNDATKECHELVNGMEALGLPCCSKGYIYKEEV